MHRTIKENRWLGGKHTGFWNRSTGLSFSIASVGSEDHGKNNGGPNQWTIRVRNHSMGC